MKPFPIRGGIHPEYRKSLTSELAIVALPLPARLYIPLQQHIGAPAEALVAAGDQVGKGQLIARSQGDLSASKHAPTSGTIEAIAEVPGPHPSGLAQTMIILIPDGADTWAELPAPIAEPFAAAPAVISERVAASGIVGLGGAAFPTAIKLGLGERRQLDTLLINGAECEPYLTCDDRIMREHAAEVIDGARLMGHALGVAQIRIAIEDNKPQAIAAMLAAAMACTDVTVMSLPTQYPMGSERHLVQAVTGRETPAKALTAELGVVVHNVGTARAVHRAVRFGQPLTHRVVTVSGAAVCQPKNIETPIGAPLNDLIAFCGGFASAPQRVINGGPMMGQPLTSLDVPVVKGTSAILALTAEELGEQPASPCIRCGSCVSVCPCGLVPVEMAAYIRKDKLDGAARLGVADCIGCGSCSWVCPAHIPLLHFFNYAKGRLRTDSLAQRKIEHTRPLVEARTQRLEKAAARAEAAEQNA